MRLMEAAAVMGRWCWRQDEAFRIVGAWAMDEDDDEARIRFFSHSRRMGGHAVSFAALLPEVAGASVGHLIVPTGADRGLVDALSTAEETPARLEALYGRYSPACVGEYRDFLARSSPLGDMPLIRVVASALADEEQDLRAGRALADARR